ncbi:MAG: hypothetical protein JWO13_2403 [Acidobacteriales bacterium]|nr:hypothetical protein [Terriglobales bacterium]
MGTALETRMISAKNENGWLKRVKFMPLTVHDASRYLFPPSFRAIQCPICSYWFEVGRTRHYCPQLSKQVFLTKNEKDVS